MDASFFSKPLSQLESRENKKSCHLLEKKDTHPMRMDDNNTTCNRSNQNAGFLDTTNTTCNRSNQNARLPDTHSRSTNQHPAAPDTTKTTCYPSAAQCWKAFLLYDLFSQDWGGMAPSPPPGSAAEFDRTQTVLQRKFVSVAFVHIFNCSYVPSNSKLANIWTVQSIQGQSGWPRHRENREFGSYFFQTGKTQGILFWHRENFSDTGKIFFVTQGKI